jgi:hypothetical protein
LTVTDSASPAGPEREPIPLADIVIELSERTQRRFRRERLLDMLANLEKELTGGPPPPENRASLHRNRATEAMLLHLLHKIEELVQLPA